MNDLLLFTFIPSHLDNNPNRRDESMRRDMQFFDPKLFTFVNSLPHRKIFGIQERIRYDGPVILYPNCLSGAEIAQGDPIKSTLSVLEGEAQTE